MFHKLFPKRNSIDPRFRAPRIWSNRELARFASLFHGSVVNVSGWTDVDKEGRHYRDYFVNADSYHVTNYSRDDVRGAQGTHKEILLDLEAALPSELENRFSVAFCHTVLEHVFEVRTAFSNLCRMAQDAVSVVVPYMQQVHGFSETVGDYWRFTPLTMKRLYTENGLTLRYCSANGDSRKTSIYLFAIGYPGRRFDEMIPDRFDLKLDASCPVTPENVIGSRLIDS